MRVGTDAALALGMAHVMLAEGLFKADFVKEQTDLPLLVREDNGKFLRQSDREAGGADNVFYLWDGQRNALAEAPGSEGLGRGTTLRLGALDPVLEGSWTVALANGSEVRVRPVFEHLRDRILADYSPEQAAAICGVGAAAIRELAREFAAARPSRSSAPGA